jgi:hypothetical protein
MPKRRIHNNLALEIHPYDMDKTGVFTILLVLHIDASNEHYAMELA